MTTRKKTPTQGKRKAKAPKRTKATTPRQSVEGADIDAAVARGEPLELLLDESERGSQYLDEIECSLMMDVANAPDDPHWTDDRGDATRRALIPLLAKAVAHKMDWQVAEPISRWRVWLVNQTQLAKTFGVSPRWLQELELRGLPSEGHRGSKLYPWPDAWVWWTCYSLRQAAAEARGRYTRRDRAEQVTVSVARAEHDLRRAEEWDAMLRGTTRAGRR